MKKLHFKTVFWMSLSIAFACAFLYAQSVRNRIHDIIAIPLHVSSQQAQAGIIATDAAYNWAKDTLMFSIEVSINHVDDSVYGEWIITDGNNTIMMKSKTVQTENKDLIILQGNVPRKQLNAGEWTILAQINDDDDHPLQLTNNNPQEGGIPIVSFISD